MAFSRTSGFTSLIADDAAATAAGEVTPSRYNLAHKVADAVSGGIPFFSSTTAEGTSALLAENSLVIGGGAGAAPFTSANLSFASTKLTVGSGSGTSAGLIIGYSGTSSYGGIWPTSVTPTISNYAMVVGGGDKVTFGSPSTANDAFAWSIHGLGTKATLSGTAGQGFLLTAGTATTDVAAMSITRTNNNAAVATGVKWTFTDTTSAAGFLPFQILGGSAATTNLFSLSKTGAAKFGASVSLPNSGAAATVGNAVLVAGTVTVSTTAIQTADIVVLTRKTSGGTLGTAITYTISDATSFTITSDSALDTSTFSWVIVKAH